MFVALIELSAVVLRISEIKTTLESQAYGTPSRVKELEGKSAGKLKPSLSATIGNQLPISSRVLSKVANFSRRCTKHFRTILVARIGNRPVLTAVFET